MNSNCIPAAGRCPTLFISSWAEFRRFHSLLDQKRAPASKSAEQISGFLYRSPHLRCPSAYRILVQFFVRKEVRGRTFTSTGNQCYATCFPPLSLLVKMIRALNWEVWQLNQQASSKFISGLNPRAFTILFLFY